MGAPRLAHNVTVKQETFAQGVASGLSLSDAYRAAYDVNGAPDGSIHVQSSRLMDDSNVSLRVDALQKRKALLADINVESIAAELEIAREIAQNAKVPQAASMIAATVKKANLVGLLLPKMEIDKRSMAVSVDATADELRALIDAHPDIAQLATGQGVDEDM